MPNERTNTEVTDGNESDRREIIQMAREEYEHSDGDVQIDGNAVVSHGTDNGAYVQAWVWVSFADSRFDKEPTLAATSPSGG